MIDDNSKDILTVRQELRRAAIASRDQMAEGVRATASTAVIARLKNHLAAIGATYIHCYINFRSEVETRTFIEESLTGGMRIVVPVVEELDGREWMAHTEIKGLTGLKRGAFGLEEPSERDPSSLDDLGAVVVPLVTFDRHGARLGYGKGFYDKFLAQLPKSIPRIGLAFAIQEEAHIPILSHDERLGVVITEIETILI
jgi:5-formyltetrahydrofolate cyclo-ligase